MFIAHLNTNYRHFLLFIDEVGEFHTDKRSAADCSAQFSLLSEKDLIPLEDFNKTILEETASK